MTLEKRNVFDLVYHLTTAPWAGGTVTFRLKHGSLSAAGIHPSDDLVVTIEADGSFEAELWANTTGVKQTEYLCILPGRQSYEFSVPPGERVRLTQLILGSAPATPDQEQLLSVLADAAVDAHNTDETAHADIRAAIATLQLGWQHQGNYQADTTYVANDVVELDGSSYVAITTTIGNAPPNATYWRLVAEKGDPGAPGSAGPAGPAGAAGPQGAPGAAGPAGVVAATTPLVYDAATQTLSISPATSGAAGSMSAADKAKLDGIEVGAIAVTTGDGRYARTSIATTQLFGDPTGSQTGIFVRSGSGYAALFGSMTGIAFSCYTSGGMGAFEATVTQVAANVPAVVTTEQRYGDETPGAGYGVRRRTQLKSTTTIARDAAYDDTIWTSATDATRTAERRIYLAENGVVTEVMRIDHNDDGSQTTIMVMHDGTLKRVRVGDDGTGPGGVGRALYID